MASVRLNLVQIFVASLSNLFIETRRETYSFMPKGVYDCAGLTLRMHPSLRIAQIEVARLEPKSCFTYGSPFMGCHINYTTFRLPKRQSAGWIFFRIKVHQVTIRPRSHCVSTALDKLRSNVGLYALELLLQ